MSLRWATNRADSVARNGPDRASRAFGQYLAAAGGAYLSLVRGDTAGALRRFKVVPDTNCTHACRILEHLVTARVLEARGQAKEAAVLLDDYAVFFNPLLILVWLERARLAETLGDRKEAIRRYDYVARVWANADPELQWVVREARAALARL